MGRSLPALPLRRRSSTRSARSSSTSSASAAAGRGIRCPPRTVNRIPEPRQFRWARSAWFRVHLTRDDHTCQAMFQALALASIGSRKYKVHASATDEFIILRAIRAKRELKQLSVGVEGHVDPLDK